MPYPRTQNLSRSGLNLLSSHVTRNPYRYSWTALELASAKLCPSSLPKHVLEPSPQLSPHPIFVQLDPDTQLDNLSFSVAPGKKFHSSLTLRSPSQLSCDIIIPVSSLSSSQNSVAPYQKHFHSSSHILPCRNNINVYLFFHIASHARPIIVFNDVCMCTYTPVKLNLKRKIKFIIDGSSPANMKLSQQEDHVISPCDNVFYWCLLSKGFWKVNGYFDSRIIYHKL